MTPTEFKRWLNAQIQEIEPHIGEPSTPAYADTVATAKAYAYLLGLHDFALSLPDNELGKTPLTAANQLRRCLEALETPTPPVDGGAMSVAQAAGLLGVSKETVYKLCAEGDLSHSRIGTRITITPDQLAEYRQLQAR